MPKQLIDRIGSRDRLASATRGVIPQADSCSADSRERYHQSGIQPLLADQQTELVAEFGFAIAATNMPSAPA